MEERSGRGRLPWMILVVVVLLNVTAEVISLSQGSALDISALGALTFPIVGALIAFRRPDNAMGWIMLAIGVFIGLSQGLALYAYIGLSLRPGSLPAPAVALALDAHTWIPVIGLSGTFVLLLFPDGRVPSPRWKPWAWYCAVAMVLCYVIFSTVPTTFGDMGYPNVENPLGIDALRVFGDSVILIALLIPVAIVGCAVSLIQRFRRSRGRARLQLKWLTAAAGVVAVTYFVLMALNFIFGDPDPRWLTVVGEIGLFSFWFIPVAVGVAILRHRLYDIDVIINRTLVYGSLTATLTAAYYALVTALQAVLSPVAGQSQLAVAGSTLAVAAIFSPARRAIQRFVDRRFYRSRFDAETTVQRFSARLRDEVDLEALTNDLLAVVDQTMKPASASLWLRAPVRAGESEEATTPARA